MGMVVKMEDIYRLELDEMAEEIYNSRETIKEQDKELKELKDKLDKQTKEYQKILCEQQNEIDQLERNCDAFNEQMNDAAERLNKELDKYKAKERIGSDE